MDNSIKKILVWLGVLFVLAAATVIGIDITHSGNSTGTSSTTGSSGTGVLTFGNSGQSNNAGNYGKKPSTTNNTPTKKKAKSPVKKQKDKNTGYNPYTNGGYFPPIPVSASTAYSRKETFELARYFLQMYYKYGNNYGTLQSKLQNCIGGTANQTVLSYMSSPQHTVGNVTIKSMTSLTGFNASYLYGVKAVCSVNGGYPTTFTIIMSDSSSGLQITSLS